jgi:integrase
VRVGELLDDLLVEYQANDRRSIERAKYSVAHLRGVFGDARAQTLDRALVSDYVVRRKAARKADDGTEIPGATNGTINRELAALKRSLTLAVQRRKILTRPYIPLLAENNARQGLFEPEQLTAVLRHLPEAIRPVATFAYLTGWRLSEIINLTWRQVDFGAATVRLEPGTTKNRAGRMFPFTPELRALLEAPAIGHGRDPREDGADHPQRLPPRRATDQVLPPRVAVGVRGGRRAGPDLP